VLKALGRPITITKKFPRYHHSPYRKSEFIGYTEIYFTINYNTKLFQIVEMQGNKLEV